MDSPHKKPMMGIAFTYHNAAVHYQGIEINAVITLQYQTIFYSYKDSNYEYGTVVNIRFVGSVFLQFLCYRVLCVFLVTMA